jgi:predicted unusual protein kinase regulating ubiquinone biosynthesis (AarF/ABC1/UbiB family)
MLGAGSFGQVYHARDAKIGVECAIKVEEQKVLSQLNTEAYVL